MIHRLHRGPGASWPAGLGAVGAQNDLRYAVFPERPRQVIDDRGTVSIYDTVNTAFLTSPKRKALPER